MFLENCWYQAGWADEVQQGTLLARTIAERPLLFFRDVDGNPAILDDLCPHRFVPLSKGQLRDGVVTCGYHGLSFGADGQCVNNPHGPIPKAAKVHSYPTIERHQALWVWLGDEAKADPAAIPDLSFIDRHGPDQRVAGHLRTRANYQLMVDNIMDLSHADYLHADSLGGGINTRAKSSVEETQKGDVIIRWEAKNEQLPPVMNSMLPTPGTPGDFLNEVTWSAPGIMRQRLLSGPAGELKTHGKDSMTSHIMTPETRHSTHYFYCHTSDPLRDDPSLAAMIDQTLRKAFEGEDAPMIEAQQVRIRDRDFWSLNPVLLSTDSGAVRVRRKLDQLLQNETRQR